MSNNVDQAEINKFSEQAQAWWDPSGPFKTLHEINPLRLHFIEQHTNLKEKRSIDVGCGGGLLAEAMAKKEAEVSAIDMSEASIECAKQHAESSGLSIDYQTIEVEAFAKTHAKQFDIVSCMEMLEHVPDPSSIIKACATLCKPDGYVFFSTINRNLKSFLMMIVGAEYMTNLVPKGTHQYEKFIKPSELNRWACEHGLSLKDLKGLRYDPITHEHRLNNDVDVNFIMCLTPNN